MLMLKQWPLVIICVCAMVVVLLIVRELMRPFIMQRQREVKCQHAFKEYRQEVEGFTVYQVFFCERCGARRVHAMDVQIGANRRHRVKVTKAKDGK